MRRWFRAAQHLDLQGGYSNGHYERALSYRYFRRSPSPAVPTPEAWADWPEATVEQPLLRRPFQVPELFYLEGPVAAFRLKANGSQEVQVSDPEAR